MPGLSCYHIIYCFRWCTRAEGAQRWWSNTINNYRAFDWRKWGSKVIFYKVVNKFSFIKYSALCSNGTIYSQEIGVSWKKQQKRCFLKFRILRWICFLRRLVIGGTLWIVRARRNTISTRWLLLSAFDHYEIMKLPAPQNNIRVDSSKTSVQQSSSFSSSSTSSSQNQVENLHQPLW